ncbi:hypothetical protein SLA2020_188800 [Shorea laevis]
MIVQDHLAKFEGMDVAMEVYANLELKKVYDQSSSHVSLVESLIEEEEGLSSFWDVGDSTMIVHSGCSFVDVEVSQDVLSSPNA